MIFKKPLIFRRRRINPIKAVLQSLVATRSAISKLDVLLARITERREYLIKMAIKLDEMGNSFLAKKYLEEAKRLETIEQRITYIKLVMEKLCLTLELSIELKDFSSSLTGVMEVISILKKLPESTIPDFGVKIAELETHVREALASASTGLDYGRVNEPSITRSEALKILEEAKSVAKQKLLNDLSAAQEQ